MPLCPHCLDPLSPTLTCACGWQPALPVTPALDMAALQALVGVEVRRQLAAQQEALARRITYPSGWGAYRAFGVGGKG